MSWRLITAQLLRLGAFVILLTLVPFAPTVTGLPRHRITEMALFWTALGMFTLAGGLTRTMSLSSRHSRLASTGITIAVAVCWFCLTNLLFSSLQGVHLLDFGTRPGGLYPREIGYLLAFPLITALGMQLPACFSRAETGKRPKLSYAWQATKLSLVVLLATHLVIFAASLLLFTVDRWYAVVTVVVTWLASFVFLVLAITDVIQMPHREHACAK